MGAGGAERETLLTVNWGGGINYKGNLLIREQRPEGLSVS